MPFFLTHPRTHHSRHPRTQANSFECAVTCFCFWFDFVHLHVRYHLERKFRLKLDVQGQGSGRILDVDGQGVGVLEIGKFSCTSYVCYRYFLLLKKLCLSQQDTCATFLLFFMLKSWNQLTFLSYLYVPTEKLLNECKVFEWK